MNAPIPRILIESTWRGRLFGAQWRPAIGGSLDVLEPATGAVITRVGNATAEDVRQAAAEARAAQPGWAATPYDQRAAILRKVAALMEENQGELVYWIMRETGGIEPKAGFEVQMVVSILHRSAAMCTEPQGLMLPSDGGRLSLARRVPRGVIGVISPFNFPLILSSRAVAPALATGNAVVLKPDPRTALTGLGAAGQDLQHALGEAGLPKGVLQVLPGGAEAGERGARIGLEHDRVAGGQRGRDRAARQDEREVERRDHADHAARHAPGEREAATVTRQHQALRLRAHGGGAVQDAHHHLHLEAGLGLDAAGLAHDPVDQLPLVLLHERGDLAQDRGALVVGRGRPSRLRGARLGGGLAHVLGGGIADARDHRSGRRLQHIERAANSGTPLRAEQAAAPRRLDEYPRYRRVHSASPPGGLVPARSGSALYLGSAPVRGRPGIRAIPRCERRYDRIQPTVGGQDCMPSSGGKNRVRTSLRRETRRLPSARALERAATARGAAPRSATFRHRFGVSQALERIWNVFAVIHPGWEPYAGKPHVRFYAGGVR